MSGRLHHPLNTSADPGMESNTAEEESGRMGRELSSQEESSQEGEAISEQDGSARAPWTTGLPVESAADIAGDSEPGRFSRAHAVGTDSGASQAPYWTGDPAPNAGWSAPVDHAPPAGTVAPADADQEVPDEPPVAEGWHAGERAETLPAEPSPVPPAEADTTMPEEPASEAAPEPSAPSAAGSTSLAGPTSPAGSAMSGIRVQMTVWVDAELRRRLTAAHEHTAADEGYDSLSDYVSSVLDQDVERLERTYNDGAAFPGGQTAAPQDGTLDYQVRARYTDGLWELRIGDEGITLSPTLAGAETMARTYVGLLHGVPADDIAVDVVPELEGGLSEEIAATGKGISRAEVALEQARAALAAAEEQLREARDARHALLDRLRSAGLSDADTDTVLALTPTK